ncbi:MAG: hypothetical protein RJA19_1493 [Bacteroidota bacterium]|jgi:hypothetical protein
MRNDPDPISMQCSSFLLYVVTQFLSEFVRTKAPDTFFFTADSANLCDMIRNAVLLGFVWVCHGLFLWTRLGSGGEHGPGWLAQWNAAIGAHSGLYLLTLGVAAATVAASTVVRFDELPRRMRWWWVPAVGVGAAGWVFQCFVTYLHGASDLA